MMKSYHKKNPPRSFSPLFIDNYLSIDSWEMVVHNRFSKWLNLDLSTLRGDCRSVNKNIRDDDEFIGYETSKEGLERIENSRVDILLCWIIRRTTSDINTMHGLIYAHIIYAEMVRKC